MTKARICLGMKKHFQQLTRTWAGKECTHVIITEEIDDFGQIIDRSQTTSIITGVIGDASFKENGFPIGSLQPGDLCGMFLCDDDVQLSQQLTDSTSRQDHIIFQNIEYRIVSVDYGYDLNITTNEHEAVFGKYLLRRITQ